MKYLALILCALLMALPALGGVTVKRGPGNRPAGGDTAMFDYCKQGGKGVGYDSDTGLYEATCGTYNWSSQVGGVDANDITDYDTATTVGGNSWVMDCTGDGTATGNPNEEVVCLEDGEQIQMYVMADWMLAHDNTKRGGKIYIPPGIYHDKGCGQDADGNANSCPVLQDRPTHWQRRIQAYGGRNFVGAGIDGDGPEVGGRISTWLISDHGNDANTCDIGTACTGAAGSQDCDCDPADGVTFGNGATPHWAWRVGMHLAPNTCYRDEIDIGCVVSDADEQSVGFSSYGDRTSMPIDFTILSGATDICLDDDVATAGVCADNPMIVCTDTVGGRLTNATGDCVFTTGGDLGPCQGVVTQAEADRVAGIDLVVTIQGNQQAFYGDETTTGANTWGMYGRPTGVGAVCNGTDLLLSFDDGSPIAYNRWDTSEHTGIAAVQYNEDFDNTGGGFTTMNFMAANWIGRDSDNNDADCAATGDDACDELDLFALGAGLSGGFDSIRVGHAGGGDEFSVIDGVVMGFGTILKDSLIAHGRGLISDASGWVFTGNTFRDWDCGVGSCWSVTFSPGFVWRDNIASDIQGAQGFNPKGFGGVVDGFDLHQVNFTNGIVRLFGSAHGAVFKNFQGYGVRGPLVEIGSNITGEGSWNIKFEDWNIRAFNPHQSNTNRPPAMIVVSDLDGFAGYDGNELKNISFEGIHASTSTQANIDPCMIWFGGRSGDESDAANGLNRNVDDYRNELHFKDIGMELAYNTGGSPEVFCLGNAVNGENDGTETLRIIGSESGLPAWEGLELDGVKFPDNRWATQLAATVPDCGGLISGTIVHIHDDTVSGGCTDAGNDGLLDGGAAAPNMETALCICDPTGNGASGAWTAMK